ESCSEHDCAAQNNFAWSKAVDERTDNRRVENNHEGDERKRKRNCATTPSELFGQRLDKNTERASDKDGANSHGDATHQHHPPTIKDPPGRGRDHSTPPLLLRKSAASCSPTEMQRADCTWCHLQGREVDEKSLLKEA